MKLLIVCGIVLIRLLIGVDFVQAGSEGVQSLLCEGLVDEVTKFLSPQDVGNFRLTSRANYENSNYFEQLFKKKSYQAIFDFYNQRRKDPSYSKIDHLGIEFDETVDRIKRKWKWSDLYRLIHRLVLSSSYPYVDEEFREYLFKKKIEWFFKQKKVRFSSFKYYQHYLAHYLFSSGNDLYQPIQEQVEFCYNATLPLDHLDKKLYFYSRSALGSILKKVGEVGKAPVESELDQLLIKMRSEMIENFEKEFGKIPLLIQKVFF